jgi:hypothetical protein
MDQYFSLTPLGLSSPTHVPIKEPRRQFDEDNFYKIPETMWKDYTSMGHKDKTYTTQFVPITYPDGTGSREITYDSNPETEMNPVDILKLTKRNYQDNPDFREIDKDPDTTYDSEEELEGYLLDMSNQSPTMEIQQEAMRETFPTEERTILHKHV